MRKKSETQAPLQAEIETEEARALLAFAIERMADTLERCQQGGDCPNLATHFSAGEHLMCLDCVEHWFPSTLADDWDGDKEWLALDLAAGVARRAAGGGYERRLAAVRLDAPGVPHDYAQAKATIDAMLVVRRFAPQGAP